MMVIDLLHVIFSSEIIAFLIIIAFIPGSILIMLSVFTGFSSIFDRLFFKYDYCKSDKTSKNYQVNDKRLIKKESIEDIDLTTLNKYVKLIKHNCTHNYPGEVKDLLNSLINKLMRLINAKEIDPTINVSSLSNVYLPELIAALNKINQIHRYSEEEELISMLIVVIKMLESEIDDIIYKFGNKLELEIDCEIEAISIMLKMDGKSENSII